MRHVILTLTTLALCIGGLACGPALISGGEGGERAGSALGKGDALERFDGVVEVRPEPGGGFAPMKHGVGWVYSKEGAALRMIDRSQWQITLDQQRCWFHDALQLPFGDEVLLIKGHVCFAELEPAPPPTRYLLAGMVFSDGSGIPVLEVKGGSYHVAGPKSLFERITADCRAEGNPNDRVEGVDSAYDPSLTVECKNADGVRFIYYAYLPGN